MKLRRFFGFNEYGSTIKQEVMAGVTSFVTIAYIIIVNASFLQEAGIPYQPAIIATVLTSFVGCIFMGFWANAPVILTPGMGINAFFTYVMVQSMGLAWQEALAAVFIASLIFVVVAFSRFASLLSHAVPQSLKDAITVGIGFFLTFIGLQKGGLVVSDADTFVALGDLGSPPVIVTILTLIITVILFSRNVKGNLLLGVIAGTILALIFGVTELSSVSWRGPTLGSYQDVFNVMSFDRITSVTFWMVTLSVTMVIVFENMGVLHGLLSDKKKYRRAYQASALSAVTSGLLGSSPTMTAVESASGINTGGKTGVTALITGLLFIPALFLMPLIQLIPDSAIAPILIIIGALMIQNIQNIDLQDFTEWFPAFLIIALIPLTSSIVDGMAFGFIAYPVLKMAQGRTNEINATIGVIACLFILNFLVYAI
ncbi:NCS2 family permease [Tuberibacillus sp. Marseille-P3662]|uniref:NCS2 family permease n=1 Tax=Tuberibacillus sp. Marseille-P3662 TaxID=1965358 RepID=UPI000A1CC458|nr:NCS2 family permease [Tuberibacillus sp. Marseille-P3662]